jgi:hypothetical protein
VLARTCQLLDDFATAGLLPQPLEQQRRPDASAGDLERRSSSCAAESIALAENRAPDRNSRSSWPLACNSS